MKKRIVAFVLMLPVAVFMLAAASRAKPIVLKFSDINAKKSAAGVFCEKFAELTEKKTEGRVKIQTYYGGTLT
ncbi:MAG: TRAP transporter substrate-binding protein, partial [Deltaproteobacteria bacterium]|nr:TRAP transporter substrate-binding protein [Deltaproteobacteria bacterium]